MSSEHDLGELSAEELASHSQTPFGPSSDSICRVTNGNVCGSGCIVGKQNGKSLILTNAHVAGSVVGKLESCFFPKLGKRYPVRVIMAGYSDRIMMDWAVLQAEEAIPLPSVKLMKDRPTGEHYTGGFPRCQGPYYQKLITQGFTYNGTVWKWQPNAIGGQSGSSVHSFRDNLCYGLLTWSWGGDGAGQTVNSIWHQYVNRSVVGFPRPADLIELGENRPPAGELEEGFFQQTNITTLDIWAHLDQPDDPVDPNPPSDAAVKAIGDYLEATNKDRDKLIEDYRRFQGSDGNPADDEDGTSTDGPLFGL